VFPDSERPSAAKNVARIKPIEMAIDVITQK